MCYGFQELRLMDHQNMSLIGKPGTEKNAIFCNKMLVYEYADGRGRTRKEL